MKNFYTQLPKSAKFIFLLATIPLSAIIGGIIGFIYGLAAINFFPDKCAKIGTDIICQNPVSFLGFIGWEGTALLGLIIGAVLALSLYIFFIIRLEVKNKKTL